MSWQIRWIAPCLLSLALGASAVRIEAEEPAFSPERIRKFIAKSMKAHEVTGLSAAVYDETGIRWAEGFGWEDRRKKRKASPETLYRLGSITKLFTGLAIMQLVEEGKIDLDGSLLRYLPDLPLEIPEAADPPTVRSILMHLSGLPSDHLNGMWGVGAQTRGELFESLRGETLAAPVDHVPSYSNLGFSLLGHVIEAVSGERYEAYVKHHLFEPMGMSSSSVTDGHGPRLSRAYLDGKEREDPALRDLAAGAANSSVVDMAALAELVFRQGEVGGRQILKPETWRSMIAPQETSSPFVFEQELALAWWRVPFEIASAGSLIGHSGGTGLFFSLFLCLPDSQICALTLTNSRGGAAAQAEIARGLLLSALEEKTGWVPEERDEPSPSRVKMRPEDLAKLPGTYVTEVGLLNLETRGRKIKGEADGIAVELIRMDDGFFHPKIRAAGFLKVTVNEIALSLEEIAEREVLVQHREGRRALFGEKISLRPPGDSWKTRVGTYRVLNAKSDAQMSDLVIAVAHGHLVAEYSATLLPGGDQAETLRMILLPVSDTEAVVAGLGRSRGDRLRFVATEQGEQLLYSGFQLQKQPLAAWHQLAE